VDEDLYGRVRPNKLPQIIHSIQKKEKAA
jgi:hypothetical protein